MCIIFMHICCNVVLGTYNMHVVIPCCWIAQVSTTNLTASTYCTCEEMHVKMFVADEHMTTQTHRYINAHIL